MEVSCHCGNITLKANYKLEEVGECNCSICRRYAASWAYYPPQEVVISFAKEKSIFYIWGDKEVEFHRCHLCGCITHYKTTPQCASQIIAINMKMADTELLQSIPVRKIDGAQY